MIRAAPWWTGGRALTIVGAPGGCTILGAWVTALRRRGNRQTNLIRDQVAKKAHLGARHRDIVENASDFIVPADFHMPEMDGGKFARVVHEDPRLAKFPSCC